MTTPINTKLDEFDPEDITVNDEEEYVSIPDAVHVDNVIENDEVKEEAIEETILVNENTETEKPCFKPYNNNPIHNDQYPSEFLTGNYTLQEAFDAFIKLEEYLDSKEAKENKDDEEVSFLRDNLEILSNIQIAMPFNYLFNNHEFKDVLNNGKYKQFIKDGLNKEIPTVSHPKVKRANKGNDAVAFVTNRTGAGKITRVKLYASGLVLDLKPFTSHEMLNLAIQLADEKYTLGMKTKGVIYSSDDVYIIDTILNSILQHVFDCNIKNWNNDIEKIKKLLNPLDIQALFTGALKAIYPDGYPIYYTCVNHIGKEEDNSVKEDGNEEETKDIIKCNFTIEAERDEQGLFKPQSLINFDALIRTSFDKLTPDHIAFILAKEKKSEEDILGYQNSLNLSNTEFNECLIYAHDGHKAYAKLKTPLYSKYVSMCYKWISRITQLAEEAIKIHSDLSIEERRRRRLDYINKHSQILDGIKQLAWIDHIKIIDDNEEPLFITDEDTISRILAEYTSKISESKDLLEKGIQKYKEQSTVSIAGFPNFACPKCGSSQVKDPNYPSLIPINVISYFFILMVRQVLMN